MKDLVEDKRKSVIVVPWTYGYQSILYNDIPILIHMGVANFSKTLFY